MDEKNQNEMFPNILNSIADPVFVKDTEFKFIFANDALCKMLGISRENIIGKTLAESLPTDQMEHFLSVDKIVFNSGQENISEELLTVKDGKILTIITKKTRFVNKDGNKYLVGIIRDVTELKEEEKRVKKSNEELERLNSLMIGREMEMINLKKELTELKEKNK